MLVEPGKKHGSSLDMFRASTETNLKGKNLTPYFEQFLVNVDSDGATLDVVVYQRVRHADGFSHAAILDRTDSCRSQHRGEHLRNEDQKERKFE